MGEIVSVGLRFFLGFLRSCRAPFVTAILIMSSIFLGMLNSHNLHASQSIVIAQGFAIAGIVWNFLGLLSAGCSGFLCIPYMTIPIEAFMVGCYVFIATVYKAGTGSCNSYADTPFGDVFGADGLPSVRDSCGMQTANFALSIVVTVVSFGCLIMEVIISAFHCAGGDDRMA